MDNTLLKEEKSVQLDSPIQMLNSDSLMHIFNFLAVAEKIKVERVNKFWQEVSKQSWSHFKELYINPKFLGLKVFGKNHDYPSINYNVLGKILKRCGRFLEKIDISSIHIDGLHLVAEYCPNVQKIICKEASVGAIEHLAENCKKWT